MHLALTLVFACILACVQAEQCMTSRDCTITTCSSGGRPICSEGYCTCATECTNTGLPCFTWRECVAVDPCRNQGGCALNNQGRQDYHCYDNRCWCGVPQPPSGGPTRPAGPNVA